RLAPLDPASAGPRPPRPRLGPAHHRPRLAPAPRPRLARRVWLSRGYPALKTTPTPHSRRASAHEPRPDQAKASAHEPRPDPGERQRRKGPDEKRPFLTGPGSGGARVRHSAHSEPGERRASGVEQQDRADDPH